LASPNDAGGKVLRQALWFRRCQGIRPKIWNSGPNVGNSYGRIVWHLVRQPGEVNPSGKAPKLSAGSEPGHPNGQSRKFSTGRNAKIHFFLALQSVTNVLLAYL
jgi:hypothetical protein